MYQGRGKSVDEMRAELLDRVKWELADEGRMGGHNIGSASSERENRILELSDEQVAAEYRNIQAGRRWDNERR